MNTNNYPEIRLALLSDNAAQQFAKALKTAITAEGLFPVIYEAAYNSIPMEIINPESKLFSFDPDYVLLHISSQGYRERFYNLVPEEKENLPQKYAGELISYIRALTDKGSKVIVNSLAMPQERLFGNYSVHTRYSLYGSILEVNSLIKQYVYETAGCYLNDIMYISAKTGLDKWYSEKLWVLAKYMCAPKYFSHAAESIASIIRVSKGKLTKCLVLDLDNTLWDGEIGEDGINGIVIGGWGIGEAYERFQNYLLELKNRGYILAVCSKNDYDSAIEPFKKHPDMRLKENDIALFVANWNNKSSNIEYIAETLNIGLDSIVFIDDSPFERNQVRSALPRVIVPEMPEDPSDFIPFLENTGILETLTFSEDDRKRSTMYKVEALRKNEAVKFENIDDYLQTLDMKITLDKFDDFHLQRIVQILQRTNQFNLRTKRYSEKDCKKFMEEGYLSLYIKLRDKFGDYGLISAIVCSTKKESTLEILEYVMSCRTFNRGVEQFVMNYLVDYSKANGISKIVGEYIPTPKNALVKDLYKEFGFELTNENKGVLTWELEVAGYREKKTFLKMG
jgi:FkbH-like protein